MDDEILCCLGEQLFHNPPSQFLEGIEHKRKWLRKMLEENGEVGKIAYRNDVPVGFLEYVPGEQAPLGISENERFVFVDCYYVRRPHQRKGIGRALLEELIKDFSKTHEWFDGQPADSIKLLAFENIDWKNAEPFHKMGFKTEFKWLYQGPKHAQTPLLLTYDMHPKERIVKLIEVKPPSKKKPVSVKVFITIPCPYGSPKFPVIRKLVKRLGEVTLEVLNLWENPSLAFEYGPTPGTAVNDKWIWVESGNYLSVLEEAIKDELNRQEKPE